MTAYEILLKKRDRQELTGEEIRFLVNAYTRGEIPDYQMAAWCMAVFFNGMNFRETTDLTLAMRDSGQVVDLSGVPGMKVDKHSTGGVGDKISLILAPLAASLGVIVPMISGRGLGHTGGTLDKLQSIPGFDIHLPVDTFRDTLRKIGACMIGQTGEIAPADKKLYALRDVTGTVESIPLISASIMSKKLAEGIDALVLDVKVGNGAFMRSFDQAVELAKYLVAIGENDGKTVIAMLTNMDEPIGHAVGNWIEMKESIETLQGKGPKDLVELTVALTSQMVVLAFPGTTHAEAERRCHENLSNGKAFSKFVEIVEAHHGNLRFIHEPESYPKPHAQMTIPSSEDGFVLSIDSLAIGLAGVSIGAGRKTKEDVIDHRAGIQIHKKVGDSVKRGDLLATVFAGSSSHIQSAYSRIEGAFNVGHNAPDKKPLILGILDKNGLREAP